MNNFLFDILFFQVVIGTIPVTMEEELDDIKLRPDDLLFLLKTWHKKSVML